ncbi:UNVERIFIED_CONTAM: hypothetical protein GTU68_031178 [Idotea baltica]|nr:hypothetical protein [Idotea baltica]
MLASVVTTRSTRWLKAMCVSTATVAASMSIQ